MVDITVSMELEILTFSEQLLSALLYPQWVVNKVGRINLHGNVQIEGFMFSNYFLKKTQAYIIISYNKQCTEM